MKGKKLVIVTLAVVAVMMVAGVAVAASAVSGDKGVGCADGPMKAGMGSGTRIGETEGLAVQNQGEGDRVRAEHCEEMMGGEHAGECERMMERWRERIENEGSTEECPGQAGECPMHRNGAPDDAGSVGNGTGFTQAGRQAVKAARRGECDMECDMQRDRMHTRDRSRTS